MSAAADVVAVERRAARGHGEHEPVEPAGPRLASCLRSGAFIVAVNPAVQSGQPGLGSSQSRPVLRSLAALILQSLCELAQRDGDGLVEPALLRRVGADEPQDDAPRQGSQAAVR